LGLILVFNKDSRFAYANISREVHLWSQGCTGQLFFVRLEVYVEPKVPAVVVRICGHGTRYLPDLVGVHLGTVKGFENIESYSESIAGPLPALASEFIVPYKVAPVADSGWIVVVSLEAFPRLLKILKDTW